MAPVYFIKFTGHVIIVLRLKGYFTHAVVQPQKVDRKTMYVAMKRLSLLKLLCGVN